MRSLKHPATIIATLALIVALAGTGYASGLISGSQIRNNSIAASKLTTSVRAGLHGTPGFYTYLGNPVSVGYNQVVESDARCPAHMVAISAGYFMGPIDAPGFSVSQVVINAPTGTAVATFYNSNSVYTMTGAYAEVVCERLN